MAFNECLRTNNYTLSHQLQCMHFSFYFISKIQHDKVYEAGLLLNFHELPLNEQRLYRFFIKSCQKPALLTIGGLAPLNLATCVTVRSCFLFSIDVPWKIYTKWLHWMRTQCTFFFSFADFFADLFDYNDDFHYGYSVESAFMR